MNIPMDDELFRKVKVWSAQNDVSMADAARALLASLVSGNGFASAIVSEATGKPISKKR